MIAKTAMKQPMSSTPRKITTYLSTRTFGGSCSAMPCPAMAPAALVPASHMKSPLSRIVTAHEADAGERLDRLLSQRFDDVSRARFQRLIINGSVQVDGRTIVEPSFRVKPASEIRMTLPQPSDPAPRGEAMRLAVIHEDAALDCHRQACGPRRSSRPRPSFGDPGQCPLAHCGDSLSGIGGVRRPGIVHRLDKDTSGLLVVAKTDQAHKGLSELFAAHGRMAGWSARIRRSFGESRPAAKG